jgi:RNA polymerase sigma factor (sigma-70 family)
MVAALPIELSRLLAPSDTNAQDEAWAAFVAEHSRLLLSAARSVTPDHDAAMDGYAYILERLREDGCRRLRTFVPDGRSRFTTWLVVVARRLCLDQRRHRYGRARGDDPAEAMAARRRLLDLVAEKDPDEIVSIGVDPEQALQVNQLHDALEAALARLAPADRVLLKLRFEDELPAREIAAVLRLPTVFHVYRRLNALLAELRVALGKRGVEDADP